MRKNKKNFITLAIVGLFSSVNFAQTPQTQYQSSAEGEKNLIISQAINASPTLKKVRDTGLIKIGYRQVSPISYDIAGKPAGFAVDLCNEAIEEIKDFLDMKALKVEYYQITSVQRMPFLEEGQIDLECGLTTNTAERRKTVNFSLPYFVTGTKMLVKKGTEGSYKSINDLVGQPVATVKSTTAVKTVDTLNKQRFLNIKNTTFDTYETAVESVITGKTKAMLLDEIILEDLKQKSSNPNALVTAGDFVSVEPLAVMMRKEKPLQDIINKRFVNMINSGQFENIYQKWFKKPVPPEGVNYNIEMSPALRDIVRFPNDIVGN